MADFKIEHTALAKEFLLHFEQEANKRVLFSGPFGTGKSTFLRDLFLSNNKFLTLSLNPINYSIGTNQDVFEWIKYDIIIELINKHAEDLQLTKEDFSTLLLSQMYLLESSRRGYSVIAPFVALSEKIGKPITEVLRSLKDVVNDFKTFRKQMEIDEGELIMTYIQRQEALLGSPYERDALSKLIATLLMRLKARLSTTEHNICTVLVIDDLDRLDPEHMFRLFNVFSAHYDVNDINKFGFDKVVFVCDIENIRKMFHHRYGMEVDFNGYIDKFYSKEVFDFNNRALIKSAVKDLLCKLPLSEKRFEQTRDYEQNSIFYEALEWVIYGFIQAREINLRMLIQIDRIPIATDYFLIRNVHRKLYAENYPLLSIFKFLRILFPSIETLETKLKRVSELFNQGFITLLERFQDSEIENIDRAVASYCLPFLLEETRGFSQEDSMRRSEDGHQITLSNELVAEFNYFSDRSFNSRIWVTRLTSTQDPNKIAPTNNFLLLYEAFKICREKGVI